MKKLLSFLFTFLGVVLLAGTAILAFLGRTMPVALPYVPVEAQKEAKAFAVEINEGNLESLKNRIYGTPELEGKFDNPVLTVLWEAYRESFSWDFTGAWYASDSGLCCDASVTVLDIPTLLPQVETVYQDLLPQKAEELAAEQVYGEDGGYDADFVLQVLADATRQVLESSQPQVQREMTLTMICRDGNWYVRPDSALLELFSGSFTSKEG